MSRMAELYDLAREVAQGFLVTRGSPNIGRTRQSAVGECSWVFLWDDDHPLFEFPLFGDTNLPYPSGYVLVSGSRDLPPVLEYNLSGPLLSSQLNAHLAGTLARLGEFPTSVTWFYWTGLELIARVELKSRGTVFIRVPEFGVYPLPPMARLRRDPAEVWSDDHLRYRWEIAAGFGGLTAETKRLAYNPVRYTQGCDAYGQMCHLASDPGQTYCTPHCIAGCTPVCWALLASCYKKQGGPEDKIWSGSQCWSIEWPTVVNPSQCQDVSTSIWDFHTYMGTTCSGNTNWANIINGGRVFADRWGLTWQWGFRDGQDYAFVKQVIDDLQPCHFSGVGQWNSYAANLLERESLAAPEGHSVIAYGYDDTQSAILICLGWGTSYSDKYIHVSDYPQNKCIFVTRYGLHDVSAERIATVARNTHAIARR